MSTLLISVLIIAGTAAIFIFFIIGANKSAKERTKNLLRRFHQAGADHGMVFSGQEILHNSIIGVDGVRQQLLIIDFINNNASTVLSLANVEKCGVKKEYEYKDFGNGKKPDLEKELRTIAIEFNLKQTAAPFMLTFYDNRVNSIYEMAALDTKAKDWQLLLSKLISRPVETVTA